MDLISNLALGLTTAASPANLLYCFLGCLLGTLIGVLPGVGPTVTIAMLLPLTFGLAPESSLIMLAGIYYGAQYGGSTTAILLNLPGEASSAVTAIDGYQMARQGRAGAALAIAAIGSFVAGTFGTIVIAAFAVPLTSVALSFGSPEFFALIVLGLISSVALARGSVIKAISMILLGLLLGLVGTDVNAGVQRFTFGMFDLADGLDIVPIAVGLFGIAEILRNLDSEHERQGTTQPLSSMMPTRDDLRAAAGPVVRGSILGSILGVLPGAGPLLSSFGSYTIEKKISREPQRFGHGAIEGVAGPESANNAGAQTSFIPMLALGVPANAVMALMMGAMIIQGIQPGPSVISDRPALFWGVIVSMWIGNVMLLLLNLPLVGIWVKLLSIPYRALFPAIIIFSVIGSFTIGGNTFTVYLITVFGILGYVLTRLGCEPAPLLLGFVLGPLLEEHLRRAMLMGRGDPLTLVSSPISASLLLLAGVLLCVLLLPSISRKRDEVFVDDGD